ncbi:ATP-binding cassette domain-containing protein [Synechococcales cyanobacterium C]|uniref:ATP-binding cassette domain-containing protein n=1 Tax=Petrachloros mirabilis ULC683 TaxID=2781853 RepID=A0A8K1ZVG1_9CYAN|nr:ABC transporter ATP-binding protein [Petrachloros mirabilis]NCJ05940.1 ATP-binding cassette domain-containing protein [Petrachloros mirabilis ULC683]
MTIPLRQYWSLLDSYLSPQKQRVVGLAIALLVSVALQAINPLILLYFIDAAMGDDAEQRLMLVAVIFMGSALATQVLSVTATYLSENVAWTATNSLRSDLLSHCLNLDLSFHQSRTPGELIERVDGDVNTLSRFFSQFTINVIGNVILLLSVLVILFFTDWRAGVALTWFSLTALGILVWIRAYAIYPWKAYRQTSAEFFGFLGECFAGTEDIQANGATQYVMRRFYQIIQGWLIVYHRARLAGTFLWGSSIGLFVLGNAIALAISTYLWNQQAITIGTVYLLFHYSNLLQNPIERIRAELEDLQKAEAGIYCIQELLHTQPTSGQGGDGQRQVEDHHSLPTGALSVTLENVWFSYEAWKSASIGKSEQSADPPTHLPTHPFSYTLQNISLHLSAGQTLGILGRTGSGKTTLIRLILGFYAPQVGSIHLGGVPTDAIPLAQLPQQVGIVTQTVQLFQTTVRNNLTLFSPKIKDEQLLHVLETLGLSTWLHSLPQGLDTYLGTNQGSLSAGQAQLLAFARIFLRDPGLVILDEASSRLDPFTEAQTEHAVDRLLHGRTGVIIAHRLKTVQRADQILILDQGQILEYGSRAQLQNDANSQFSRLLAMGLISKPN